MNDRPISFPDWKDALTRAALSPQIKAAYTREILTFLRLCKTTHSPATVELVKQHLAVREKQSTGPAREALRWFFREGRRRGAAPTQAAGDRAKPGFPPPVQVAEPVTGPAVERSRLRPMEPRPAAADLGSSDWEKALIKTMRERGLLWRTEMAYRSWAVRFVNFIAPRSPYAAAAEEVTAFLSELAVRGRASPSTQKQALNALVFLMQEALSRRLGELPFKRAYPKERTPTVLSPQETQRLFQQLDGTTLLMAELAYGSGLRLMELLRLRIHHLDFDRGQVVVHGGKGDKDRVEAAQQICCTAHAA